MDDVIDAPAHTANERMNGAGERRYYSIAQAAALLGVSRVSIWRWIRAGRLPAARLGHRTTRIKREDVERLLAAAGDGVVALATRAGDGATTAEDGRAPRADWQAMGASDHFVQFYEADAFLLDAVAEFVGAGLRADEAAIVVATAAHRAGIEERLNAAGLDVAAARDSGQYVALDAAAMLARFMVDGTPDPARFADALGSTIARAAVGRRRVRIFGEMVALLAVEGNHAATLRLEELWNGLQETHAFSLFCAYPMHRLGGAARGALLDGVCTRHRRAVPAESYTALPSTDDRLREIALLQQKARTLEAEIAERRQAESALQALLRISQKLHGSLDLEALLDCLVEEALQLVGAEGGCAGLRTPEGMVCQKVFTAAGALPLAYCWPPGHGLPGWLLVHKRPYVTNDALHDAQIVRELCEQFGVWSALSTPILDDAGEVLGFFELHNKADGSGFTLADQEKLVAVAQMASIAIQNARLYRATRQAVRLRDEFLALASHELRTPLTSIVGQGQLALRRLGREGRFETARTVRTLQVITEQGTKLSRLINQLLDISRLESGKLSLEPQPTDLTALVEQVVADAQLWSERHPISLQAPPSLWAEVDGLRLEQVLTNLLDNAVKYSPDGGPIEVVLVGRDTAVELSVRDHGLGVPPEKRAQLFERFYQAHATEARSGLGLGLYISRQIVELHGGEIRAEFPSDGGTRFRVRLPLAVPERAPLPV
jgi:excisionase family DNA binding protein